jgi:hypothetical protein
VTDLSVGANEATVDVSLVGLENDLFVALAKA